MKTILSLTIFLFLLSLQSRSQNELKKWYFGTFAGLDFITSPPTVLTNGALWTAEGCSTISDASGNLLFYTNGKNIFNSNHVQMANGSALMADESATQTGLIVQQPGSQTIFYVFSLDAQGGANGLHYSIVDMSLAAGLGSVTVRDVPLYTPCDEKLAATSHCNGTDVWIVSHGYSSNVFRSHLITASGINPVVITSTLGPVSSFTTSQGQMKFSPDGTKLGCAVYNGNFEMYDFDPSSGTVSNLLTLSTNLNFAYGCEFSADGSKFYGSRLSPSASLIGPQLLQWNLCAGSSAAIVASQYSISVPVNSISEFGHGGMQLGPDGKIYMAAAYEQSLHVIANPNLAGSACNYQHLVLSIAPKYVGFSLPSFVVYHSAVSQTTSAFTWTASCQTVTFTPPPGITFTSNTSCGSIQQGPSSLLWLFGDSGASSTASSSVTNPLYAYANAGTYSAKLVLKYPCHNDTITVPVTVTNTVPAISVSGKTEICAGETTALTALGCTSYSWNGVAGSGTMILSPNATVNYSVSGAGTSSICPVTLTVITINVLTCTSILETKEIQIRTYPNPFNRSLTVETKVAAELVLYDQSGVPVIVANLPEGKNEIDTSKLPSGIYVLHLRSAGESKIIKLIKSELD